MKKHSIFAVLTCVTGIALACSSAPPVRAEPVLRPFEPDSLQTIEKLNSGRPFLLVLWSIDCPPCREELDLLSKMTKRHPNLHLVLVSTDTMESSGQVTNLLASHQLDKIDSWVFSEAGAERLRYEIDADWYGEIPRIYFYDRAHHRTGVSGSLKAGQIEAWLGTSKAPVRKTGS